MKPFLNPRSVITLFVVLTISLSLLSCRNNNQRNRSTNAGQYELVQTAFDNGNIRLGMTYDEIVGICGKPNDVSRVNGQVSTAYYIYQNVVLDFDSSGHLYKVIGN